MPGDEGVDRRVDACGDVAAGYAAVLDGIYAAVRARNPAGGVLMVDDDGGALAKRLRTDGLAVRSVDYSEAMRGPQTVDCIVLADALRRLPEAEHAAVLRTLFRRLAPGGLLIAGDVGRDAAIAYEQLKEALGLPVQYVQVLPCAGVLTLRKPRMVLFDYGETLVEEPLFDSLRGTDAVMRYATGNRDGLTHAEIDAFVQQAFHALDATRQQMDVEVHEHTFYRFVYAYLGITFSLPPVEWERVLWDSAAPGTPVEGVREVLGALRAEGIRTGVISNIMFSGAALKDRIRRAFPEHSFEFVIASSETVFRKPNPLIFELALRRASLPAAEVWHCGDSFRCDVQGAMGVGISPVWLTGSPDGRARAAGCAVRRGWTEGLW